MSDSLLERCALSFDLSDQISNKSKHQLEELSEYLQDRKESSGGVSDVNYNTCPC
jgi:hypothetical protein